MNIESMNPTVWYLTEQDGTRLGLLELTGVDMPWTDCRFVAELAFAQVAPLFAAELDLLNRNQMDDWEAAYDRISDLGLELHPAGEGEPIRDFLLHIDGEQAWFRY